MVESRPQQHENDNETSVVETVANARASSKSTKKSSAAFKTISEVADILGVQQHVLRFWETKFTHIKPMKRGGGRRYYRPEDIDILQAVHTLLYVEGYTIKGVQKLFRDVGKKRLVEEVKKLFGHDVTVTTPAEGDVKPAEAVSTVHHDVLPQAKRKALREVLDDLHALRAHIQDKR